VTTSIRVLEASDSLNCTKSQIRNTFKHKFFSALNPYPANVENIVSS